MEVNILEDRAANLLPRQHSALRPHRPQRASGESGRHSHLPIQQMRARLAHRLVSVLRMQMNRDLVAHRSRRHKQRRLATKHLGRPSLQPVHRRVFPVHIVANLSSRHRRPHLRRRPRNRITPQINQHIPFSSPIGHPERSLAHLRQTESKRSAASCHSLQNLLHPLLRSHNRSHQQPAENLIRSHPPTGSQPHSTASLHHQPSLHNIPQSLHCTRQQLLPKLPPQPLQINALIQSQPEKHSLLKRLLAPNPLHLWPRRNPRPYLNQFLAPHLERRRLRTANLSSRYFSKSSAIRPANPTHPIPQH